MKHLINFSVYWISPTQNKSYNRTKRNQFPFTRKKRKVNRENGKLFLFLLFLFWRSWIFGFFCTEITNEFQIYKISVRRNFEKTENNFFRYLNRLFETVQNSKNTASKSFWPSTTPSPFPLFHGIINGRFLMQKSSITWTK